MHSKRKFGPKFWLQKQEKERFSSTSVEIYYKAEKDQTWKRCKSSEVLRFKTNGCLAEVHVPWKESVVPTNQKHTGNVSFWYLPSY